MTGSVIDFSSVPASVRLPDTLAQVTLASASAGIILQPVGAQGAPGPPGGVPLTREFIASAGGYAVTVSRAIGAWHALFVDGIRQQPSAYSVSGAILTIPPGLTYAGAVCCFDFYPA